MAKDKKFRYSDAILAQYEEWLAGKNHKLKSGLLVRRLGVNTIGLVQYPLSTMEEYMAKWHMGPNPWDVIEAKFHSSQVEVVDIPSPFKYKWSARVPGPSSFEIDRLEAKFEEGRKNKAKELTAKEVEINLVSLEEELINKKKLGLDETKVDVIIDETVEEDVPIEEDAIVKKLKDILEEE